MQSAREDNRGHWPAGKRRNPDRGQWSRLRLRIVRFLDEHWEMDIVSRRALAAAIGVSDRSVRRWLDGTHRPSEESQDAIAQWLQEQRECISRQKRIR